MSADRRAAALVLACYLLAAVAVTMHLWADPASHTVAGNPGDADLFAWFMRYDAAAVTHARLPALVSATMNAPQGISMMWNTSVLLPGLLLSPVTLLFGPQVSLTVLTTAGFAGSAASLFLVLRRWQVSPAAAALGGAVYGFSPALLQAAIGHYDLQLAVLPPLIIDAGLRLVTGQATARLRDGILLGLLVTAQLFISEELLLYTGMAGLLLAAGLAIGRHRAVLRRCRDALAGLAVAAAVTLVLAGYALWTQFFGPLAQHGSAFLPDFYKNDLTGFVTPSGMLLYHSAGSAAAAARYQGGAPEYLAYLGWPLIAVMVLAAATFWRHPAVRATALTVAVLELLSLGGHPLIGGTLQPGVTLPWHWLESLPLIGVGLPNRLSVIADGAAGALLAFALDQARARLGPARQLASAVVTALAVVAVLPLLPLPLAAAQTTPLPAGWAATFAALHLPPGGRVLVVPVPTATLTAALRWQADTGEPASLNGGYFIGPAWTGQAYIDGNGVASTASYLDALWTGGPAAAPPARFQVQADLATWRPAAVMAVTSLDSALGQYLVQILGQPDSRAGQVLGWRL